MKDARIENLQSATATTSELQRQQIELLRRLDRVNSRGGIDRQLAARLESFELAFRMQADIGTNTIRSEKIMANWQPNAICRLPVC